MPASRRFYGILAVLFGLSAVVCAVRVFTCGGRDIRYVPFVIGACAVFMAVLAVRAGRRQ